MTNGIRHFEHKCEKVLRTEERQQYWYQYGKYFVQNCRKCWSRTPPAVIKKVEAQRREKRTQPAMMVTTMEMRTNEH